MDSRIKNKIIQLLLHGIYTAFLSGQENINPEIGSERIVQLFQEEVNFNPLNSLLRFTLFEKYFSPEFSRTPSSMKL